MTTSKRRPPKLIKVAVANVTIPWPDGKHEVASGFQGHCLVCNTVADFTSHLLAMEWANWHITMHGWIFELFAAKRALP